MSQDDDFFAIDTDGNAIDPTAEASVAAADEFGDELFVHDGTDEWYLEGMRECEELRARLDAFVLPNSTDSEDDSSEGDSDAVSTMSPSGDTADDDGMGEPNFSREYSDAAIGEEWVLENLLRRRTTKAVQHDYDDDGALETRAVFEYLCKWKWYREPTWESRSALEDLGLVARLDAFDAARFAKPRTKKGRGLPKQQKYHPGTLEKLMGEDFAEKVFSKVLQSGMHVRQYGAVLNNNAERRFIKRWKESPDTFCPMILFHGTRQTNISSIASGGLKVPGASNGVRVVNGSAYGVGIYAAKDASYSRSYTDTDAMFVCLALVGPQYTTMTDCGNICVFFDEELIVPLWLIRFSVVAPGVPPQRLTFANTLARPPGGTFSYPPCGSDAPTTRKHRLTKQMIKQMPRSIKELYKRGEVFARKTS